MKERQTVLYGLSAFLLSPQDVAKSPSEIAAAGHGFHGVNMEQRAEGRRQRAEPQRSEVSRLSILRNSLSERSDLPAAGRDPVCGATEDGRS